MSIVSENHGGPEAPEINLRRGCSACGWDLGGRPSVARGGLDFCLACVRRAAWRPSGAGLRDRLVELGEPEPQPDCDRFD